MVTIEPSAKSPGFFWIARYQVGEDGVVGEEYEVIRRPISGSEEGRQAIRRLIFDLWEFRLSSRWWSKPISHDWDAFHKDGVMVSV
jgi:hypothetical protein